MDLAFSSDLDQQSTNAPKLKTRQRSAREREAEAEAARQKNTGITARPGEEGASIITPTHLLESLLLQRRCVTRRKKKCRHPFALLKKDGKYWKR